MIRDKRRACIACGITEISCRALTRHRGNGCCTTCDHEPAETVETEQKDTA